MGPSKHRGDGSHRPREHRRLQPLYRSAARLEEATVSLHDLGIFVIGGSIVGLISGSLGYHSGLTDGARKAFEQIQREHRRSNR